MTNDIPDDLLEIRDPALDLDAIMAEIRARIQQRRAELGVDNRVFESFDSIACPEPPALGAYNPHLFHHLRRANEAYVTYPTEPILTPSALSQLPLLGGLWNRLRPALHLLVLIYVNRYAAHQTTVNRHLVSTLNALTAQVRDQQQTITALEAEVRALQTNEK